jgi:N-acetylneuraminic acid mutarotase
VSKLEEAVQHDLANAPRPSPVDALRARNVRRRRSLTLRWALVIGVLIAVSAGVAVENGSPPPTVVVTDNRAGAWSRTADSPLSPRYEPVAVAASGRVFIWGGEGPDGHANGDGAIYDPRANAWEELAPAPLEPRLGATGVWTGRHVIVWGGELADGAAYDPASREWRPIASSPFGPRAGAQALWADGRMVVWGGNDARNASPRPSGLSYDERTDRWVALPPGPGDAHASHGEVVVATGDALIVWGGGNDPPRTDGAMYSFVTQSWDPIPAAPIPPVSQTSAVWTGSEMLIWGIEQGTANTRVAAAAFKPTTMTWRLLPRAPLTTPSPSEGRSGPRTAWDGTNMLVLGGALAGQVPVALAYAPETNEWTSLPELPLDATIGFALVAVDHAVVLWGGRQAYAARFSNDGARLQLGQTGTGASCGGSCGPRAGTSYFLR